MLKPANCAKKKNNQRFHVSHSSPSFTIGYLHCSLLYMWFPLKSTTFHIIIISLRGIRAATNSSSRRETKPNAATVRWPQSRFQPSKTYIAPPCRPRYICQTMSHTGTCHSGKCRNRIRLGPGRTNRALAQTIQRTWEILPEKVPESANWWSISLEGHRAILNTWLKAHMNTISSTLRIRPPIFSGVAVKSCRYADLYLRLYCPGKQTDV